jgi:hypothetical protein
MAGYREFHYEKQYAAPDTSQAFEAQMQGLTNLFRGMQQKQEERRRAADQFQYDLDKGAFENDTKIFGEVAKTVVDGAKNDFRTGGKLSTKTGRLMQDGKTWQQMSVNQYARAKELNDVIKGKSDPYYNPEPDLKLVKWATHGENNDVDFRTRGERLAEAEKQLGGNDTFRFDMYRADYVKRQGLESKSNEFKTKDGSYKTVFDQRAFWDKSTGKPGVTDDHAIRFLDSDQRVAKFYDSKISSELDQEIKAMKQSKDSRYSWMNGLSEAEIKNELINNPSKNGINQKDYGIRVREKAKADLDEADKVNSKVSYTNVQNDENNSGGGWKNKNILISQSVNTIAQEAKTPEGMKTVNSYGPGGRITQKTGRAVQIDTTNPIRTNTKSGITSTKNKGSVRLNLTGYQAMPFKSTGAPFALQSSTPEGMVEEVKNLPLEYFDPNGKMKLQPEMKIGLNGYVIDEAGVLGDIQEQLMTLSDQIHQAEKSGDIEKKQSLQYMEQNLVDLKEMVGAGDYDPQELLLAGNKAGVRKVQNDMIIPADDSDLATINNVTGGFNLRDKSNWSDEMKMVADAYRARAEEAKAQGYGVKKEEEKKDEPKKITPAEFNAQWANLKSGQKLVGPDGKTYTKK